MHLHETFLITDTQHFESLLGNYQARITSWIDAATSTNVDEANEHGVLNMLGGAARNEVKSVVECNVAITVLVLRNMLTVSVYPALLYSWCLT